MPSPVLPSQFESSIPLNNAEFCTRFDRFLGTPDLLSQFFNWALTANGSLSEEFKAEMAAYATPTGMEAYFATQNVGNGWLLMDGRAVLRTAYPALFQQIGTNFGAGDGSTTFNLPDGRGRSLIGAGTGLGLSNRDINAKYIGEETHTMTIAELVPHRHIGPTDINGENGAGVANHWKTQSSHPDTDQYIGETGGGQPFNIISPMVIGFLHIKT